jgi:hypothetical protein
MTAAATKVGEELARTLPAERDVPNRDDREVTA